MQSKGLEFRGGQGLANLKREWKHAVACHLGLSVRTQKHASWIRRDLM